MMRQWIKTLKLSCLALTTLAVATACSNDELDGGDSILKNANTFVTATFEQPGDGLQTKTTLGTGNKVLWQVGDAFKFFYNSDKTAVFTATAIADGGETATFGANLSEDISTPSYAVFPYMNGTNGVDVSFNSSTSTITTTLRKEIPFSKATNGPMWADASSYATGLTFSHLAGLLKLTISGLPVGEEMYLKVTSSENIAGTATANLASTEPKPYLSITGGVDASKEIKVTGITLTAESPATTATATFYVPLPVATLGTLTVGVYEKSGDKLLFKEKTWTNVAVARASIRSASFGFEVLDLDASGAKTITDVVKNAVNNVTSEEPVTTTVEISGTLNTQSNTTNATIEVPAVENKNVALVFETAPTTSTRSALTIQDANTSAAQSTAVNTITVSLPATTTDVANVAINTPQSTVELTSTATADGAKTKYTTITATTAKNTLVVGDKVEIGTINVKAGNIRLKKGSTVGRIERVEDEAFDGKVKIYMEEGATLTNTPSETDFIVITDAQDANLETVLAKGGSYILPAELKLTKPLDVYGEVTFDLNGNKVTFADTFSGGALFNVHRGGKLIVNDSKGGGSIDSYERSEVSAILVTIKRDETNTAIQDKKAIVEINAGTIKGNDYAVVGNGDRHDTEITINGGTLKSKEGPGIYHPQYGTLTINGGTITGAECGVELRSGKLVITGGTLISTADPATTEPNGNGTTTAGAALAIVQHTTKKDINVKISGGTFEGVYALFQKDIQNNNTENVKIEEVTGGTFKGEIYSQNCTAFIKGGTFTHPSVLTSYLAQNANVKIEFNKDYEGPGFGLYNTKYDGYGKGANIEVDMNNHTWTLTDTPLVGSTGYESQYFHLEKDTKVTFKNGTMKPKVGATGKMVIQNYCELVLENVTVEGDSNCAYVMSNNNGSCTINNSTITAAAGKCAFDVYSFKEYAGVVVTVNSGTINGRVEFGGNNNKQNGTLIVNGGSFYGNFDVTVAYVKEDKSNLVINGGTFFGTGWYPYQCSTGSDDDGGALTGVVVGTWNLTWDKGYEKGEGAIDVWDEEPEGPARLIFYENGTYSRQYYDDHDNEWKIEDHGPYTVDGHIISFKDELNNTYQYTILSLTRSQLILEGYFKYEEGDEEYKVETYTKAE